MKTKEEILKSQEYLSYFLNGKCEKLILDAMEEYAELQVKLLATPDVSKSVSLEGRELLLAFCQWIENDQPIAFHNMGEFVNKFLSQQCLLTLSGCETYAPK
jgi:hypothetical protein